MGKARRSGGLGVSGGLIMVCQSGVDAGAVGSVFNPLLLFLKARDGNAVAAGSCGKAELTTGSAPCLPPWRRVSHSSVMRTHGSLAMEGVKQWSFGAIVDVIRLGLDGLNLFMIQSVVY